MDLRKLWHKVSRHRGFANWTAISVVTGVIAPFACVPALRPAGVCILKFLALWSGYGAAWFVIPALLQLSLFNVSFKLKLWHFSIHFDKGPSPSVSAAMAYAIGFFSAVLHAAIWLIWW